MNFRKRHVKCDEGKPNCNRCVKIGQICGGYEYAPRPASSFQWATPVLTQSLEANPFKSSWEMTYFDTWTHLSKRIWGRCVPLSYADIITTIGLENSIVKEAILALGSLKLALDQGLHDPLSTGSTAGTHYGVALSRYNRAIRQVLSMPVNRSTLRTVLLCCILFVCFDSFDGRRDSIHDHVRHGKRILQQFWSTEEGLTELESSVRSPIPLLVDDLIIHTFQRLVTISFAHLGLQPSIPTAFKPEIEAGNRRKCGATGPPKSPETLIPHTFTTLPEAMRWLDMLYNYLISVLCPYQDMATDIEHPATDTASGWHFVRETSLSLLKRWSDAYRSIYSETTKADSSNTENFTVATQLRMRWVVAFISIHTSHSHDYHSLVHMEVYFEEIVRLAKTLPHSPGISEANHTPLEVDGLVNPLYCKSLIQALGFPDRA